MSPSTLLKVLGGALAVGFIIKTSIIGFYLTDLPLILAVSALGYGVFWLADRVEDAETADHNAELRGKSGETDNW